MRRKCKWLQITLGVLMILLVTEMQRAGAYEYEETPDDYKYEFETPDVGTDTKWEYAFAGAGADVEKGECHYQIHTITQVYADDSAEASAYAYGLHSTDWVWNGPPGTAPGGSLAWTHYGEGGAEITGDRAGSGGSTHAAASAWSLTGADAPGGLSEFFGIAEGFVDDMDLADVDNTTYYVTPGVEESHFERTPEPPGGYGWFELSIEWDVTDWDSDSIAAGTAQFSFSGAAICNGDSEADAAGDPEAWSDTEATADLTTTADFTPNN